MGHDPNNVWGILILKKLFKSYLNGHPIIFIFKSGSLIKTDELALPSIFNLVKYLNNLRQILNISLPFHPGRFFFPRLIPPHIHHGSGICSGRVSSQNVLHLLLTLWYINQSNTYLKITLLGFLRRS